MSFLESWGDLMILKPSFGRLKFVGSWKVAINDWYSVRRLLMLYDESWKSHIRNDRLLCQFDVMLDNILYYFPVHMCIKNHVEHVILLSAILMRYVTRMFAICHAFNVTLMNNFVSLYYRNL